MKRFEQFKKELFDSVNHNCKDDDKMWVSGYLYGIGQVVNEMVNSGVLTLEQGQKIESFIDDKEKSIKSDY